MQCQYKHIKLGRVRVYHAVHFSSLICNLVFGNFLPNMNQRETCASRGGEDACNVTIGPSAHVENMDAKLLCQSFILVENMDTKFFCAAGVFLKSIK